LDADTPVTAIFEGRSIDRSAHYLACADGIVELKPASGAALAFRSAPYDPIKRLSPWSRSAAKRLFDCACVLLALPLVVPLMLAIAIAVRLTSTGPVLFFQKRMGRHGRTFTIVKFRTLAHVTDKEHHAVTTAGNQHFTPVGRYLRRLKLDELPQLLNVLFGDMSLVGPRPKIPDHAMFDLPCRPGITGAATIAFACEEAVLAHVPSDRLEAYYHTVVLPAKRQLDIEYLAQATFLSDLDLIVRSVLRRWDSSAMERLLGTQPMEEEETMQRSRASIELVGSARSPMPPNSDRPAQAEEAAAS
jgi:lipopolysaccharide/colanic/teichoic acid biosynthesis glycosyltransferase